MFKEKSSGYVSLGNTKSNSHYLGKFRTITEMGDWPEGLELALETIRMEVNPPRAVRKRIDSIFDKIEQNLDEFFHRSRITIASAVVYMAYEMELDEGEWKPTEIYRELPSSQASIRTSKREIKDILNL